MLVYMQVSLWHCVLLCCVQLRQDMLGYSEETNVFASLFFIIGSVSMATL